MVEKQKINRTNITTHLIEYQLNMVGKTMVDTFDEDLQNLFDEKPTFTEFPQS